MNAGHLSVVAVLVVALACAAAPGGTVSGGPTPGENASVGADRAEASANASGGCVRIDEPGRYDLVELTAVDVPCLRIGVGDVIVDGNGSTIADEHGGGGVGVIVSDSVADSSQGEATAVRNVTLRNVAVAGWDRGLQIGAPTDGGAAVSLVNVTARDNGVGVALSGADGSKLRDVRAVENSESGIEIREASSLTVADVLVAENGGNGLSLADAVVNATVADVVARDNGESGVLVSRSSVDNRFVGVRAVANGAAGIRFADSARTLVRNGTVRDNAGPGILSDAADGDRVENVTAVGNEVAYLSRSAGARYGVVAVDLRLDGGAVVSFDAGVRSVDGGVRARNLPDGVDAVGLAVDVVFREDAGGAANVSVAFPYDADATVGQTVFAAQYVDCGWFQTDQRVDPGEETVTATVRRSGAVALLVGAEPDHFVAGYGCTEPGARLDPHD